VTIPPTWSVRPGRAGVDGRGGAAPDVVEQVSLGVVGDVREPGDAEVGGDGHIGPPGHGALVAAPAAVVMAAVVMAVGPGRHGHHDDGARSHRAAGRHGEHSARGLVAWLPD